MFEGDCDDIKHNLNPVIVSLMAYKSRLVFKGNQPLKYFQIMETRVIFRGVQIL